MAQDDYYYEIQLTNKQLVFYFMAGAAGLILSFLAGVMVGRGVDTAANASGRTQPLTEGRIVQEQPAAAPTPSEYSYPQSLEAERPAATLERPRPGSGAATPPAGAAPATPTPKPRPARPTPTATPKPATPKPTPIRATPTLPKALTPQSAGHAVQVGAFKDKASADSVMSGLKNRGFPAYVKAPAPQSGGLFTVRVGPYRDRADADVVAARLRADKFKPYIIKQ
ncbi:MAG: SPOR domain-containing protein [Acidobacteria bacterium]|nr:SPOR domain-containing protein [Acidobacteriota bacterium]